MANGNIRITFGGPRGEADDVGRKFSFGVSKEAEKRTKAAQRVTRRVAAEIEYAGRADIRSGGDFGSSRWQEGFRAFVSFASRTNMTIRVSHAVPYWRVFEYGAKILGKPLLWIPLSFGNAFGVRARDYPLPLFRVDRVGKAPLLVDPKNGPQYFGKESVTIPKKWHLRDIVKRISRTMADKFKEEMRDG